MSDNII